MAETNLTSRAASWGVEAKRALPFVASWALLDFMLNLRYPAPEPVLWYLIPSTDVLVLFGYFAVFGWNRWRVPTAVRVCLVAVVFLVRFIRLGDGIQRHVYHQAFNLYTDLPLVPELVRFSYSTLPSWKFAVAIVGVVLVCAAFAVGTYHALACAERYLSDLRNVRRAAIASVIACIAVYMIRHDPYYDDLFYGGFATSVFPRLKHEAKFLLNVYGYSREKTQAIAAAQERLAKIPANLAKLHRANVHLVLVESYGQAVFDQPNLEERAAPTLDAFEAELRGRGFSIASGALESPTYGGQSWLAHATLSTTVRTVDQLQYEILSTQHPKTIARFFRDAGYRTVLVHPGTQRAWPQGEFYQFDQKYYAWHFGYAGPKYAWATMPDQFVLDFVRRTELQDPKQPLFVQYVLVSSHAPWSSLPVEVDDWSKIGNGAIYNSLKTLHYPITWPDFDNAQEPYVRSIVYDFEILKRFIADYIRDDSLVILLGDHQPVREISGEGERRGVPVHVVSRESAFVDTFVSRGYVRGIRPRFDERPPPMEEFLVQLLRDFSTPNAGTAP